VLQCARDAVARGALAVDVRDDRDSVHGATGGKVCVYELIPLFDVSQPTLSHDLKKLRDAGIVDSERRGLWAYYYVLPEALDELAAWLG
jgi:ArsR family transcriptional regulator, arsenate/arsenite/antimonite-responsive transcriptional repressor